MAKKVKLLFTVDDTKPILSRFTKVEVRKTEICECDCHKDGVGQRDFYPCCEYSGLYIDKHGNIDYIRFAQVVGYSRTGIKRAGKKWTI